MNALRLVFNGVLLVILFCKNSCKWVHKVLSFLGYIISVLVELS